ncbi:MAG: VOC family protein [Acidobacteriota bacterium]
MDLGTFSVSLAVKDLAASRDFYTKLGFEVFDGEDFGDAKYNETWVILTLGETNIGLFQGMFEKNILTFNPEDVRGVQRRLEEAGVTSFVTKADPDTTGPASAVLEDPDGNPILLDQHV